MWQHHFTTRAVVRPRTATGDTGWCRFAGVRNTAMDLLSIHPCRIVPIAISIVTLIWVCHPVNARRDKTVNCGACTAMVDEVAWEISQIDPKKTIQVGSFRIDPQGNQKVREVPLATSEAHLTELLENICENMKNYARSVDNVSGQTTYIRTSSRNGKGIRLSNVQISGDTHKSLKFACEGLLEEHEEDIIGLLRNSETDLLTKICVDMADVCTAQNITAQLAAEAASAAEAEAQDEQDSEDGDGETTEDKTDNDEESEASDESEKTNSDLANGSDERTDSMDKEEL
ncbi:Canopy-like protein 2 [Lamellibrachia satsuma]|nr:Canopy-like protein 2 [Lamellibrachia satsuma]